MNEIVIIGAGRVGLTLARALRHSGHRVEVLIRSSRPLPDGIAGQEDWAPALTSADLILIAVPDDHITTLAGEVAALGSISARQVVLHTSGLHDRSALLPLGDTGAALGSLHPLQSFPDASGNPERLHGSPGVVEGDSRAVAAGKAIAARLGLRPVLELSSGGKAKYHAAAVFASNYVVVLAAIAQRLAKEAGIAESDARELLAPIMTETVAQLRERSPGAVLTGPVARGDHGTVAAHLAALDGRVREIYKLLAEEAGGVASRGR